MDFLNDVELDVPGAFEMQGSEVPCLFPFEDAKLVQLWIPSHCDLIGV